MERTIYETIIIYNSEDRAATVTIKGNNQLYDHLEKLVSDYPDKCSRFENSYLVPKGWIRILPFIKKIGGTQ